MVERGKGLTAIVYPDYERMDADKVDMQALPELMEANRNELNSLVAPLRAGGPHTAYSTRI